MPDKLKTSYLHTVHCLGKVDISGIANDNVLRFYEGFASGRKGNKDLNTFSLCPYRTAESISRVLNMH